MYSEVIDKEIHISILSCRSVACMRPLKYTFNNYKLCITAEKNLMYNCCELIILITSIGKLNLRHFVNQLLPLKKDYNSQLLKRLVHYATHFGFSVTKSKKLSTTYETICPTDKEVRILLVRVCV